MSIKDSESLTRTCSDPGGTKMRHTGGGTDDLGNGDASRSFETHVHFHSISDHIGSFLASFTCFRRMQNGRTDGQNLTQRCEDASNSTKNLTEHET